MSFGCVILLICLQRFLFNFFSIFLFFINTRFFTFFILGVKVFYIYGWREEKECGQDYLSLWGGFDEVLYSKFQAIQFDFCNVLLIAKIMGLHVMVTKPILGCWRICLKTNRLFDYLLP